MEKSSRPRAATTQSCSQIPRRGGLSGRRSPRTGAVVALAFNPDGSMLASGSEDRSVVLWDVQTRQQVGPRLVKHVNPVRGLGFSEDGDHLFSISSAFDTAHWDLDPATFAARCRRARTET
jgi:WD40 repeat protein